MYISFLNLYIDWLSFTLGFIIATVLWWFIMALRPILQGARENLAERRAETKTRVGSGLEESYRRNIFRYAQGLHLASSLCSLDEILMPVRLLAPRPIVEPGRPHPLEDNSATSLPYMPEWPELGAIFDAPSLSLPQALSGGANLVITGQPGSGKSVALAHLASLAASRDPQAGALGDLLPVMVHVSDLELSPKSPAELLNKIITASAAHVSMLGAARLPAMLQAAFQEGRILLLLDGVDELPQARVLEVGNFLRQLLKAFPGTRVVVAGSAEFIDGLFALNFSALSVLPWNPRQQKLFLDKWAGLWEKFVIPESWAQTLPQAVDATLLNTWLETDNLGLTPFEYTLKVWAAYAGDLQGPGPIEALEAHVRRLTPADLPLEALQILALQSILESQPCFDQRRAREWVKSFEPPEETGVPAGGSPETSEGSAAPEEAKPGKRRGAAPAPSREIVARLVESGLLLSQSEGQLRFLHPVLAGYLAGQSLSKYNATGALQNQPVWSGQTLAIRYMAASADLTPLIELALQQQDPILGRPAVRMARWLREAPRQSPWRARILSALLAVIQNKDLAFGLRAQAAAGFVLSNDPAAATLFRQLLGAGTPELRRLGAIGSGALQDVKAVEALTALLADYSSHVRQTACMALVAINTHPALEALATALLRGDEDLRRAAAESLATHPEEGYAALKDGIRGQDILLRRAAVFGLGRVGEPWALELLERVQVEDEQWIVRNAAVEILETRKHPDARIPRSLPPASDAPWVIEFAGRFGMGVSPGQPATDVMLLALKSEKSDEQRGALAYLRRMPTEGVIAGLYHAYFSGDPELREEIHTVLSAFAAGGVALPDPVKYGLG